MCPGLLATEGVPFSATYYVPARKEEVLFAYVVIASHTVSLVLIQVDSNGNLLEKSLDLIKERRENVMVQLAYYQQKLKQGYDSNIRIRPLAPRDLVLSKVVGITKNPAWGKLGPNWEGSYCITSMAGIGAYFLKDLDENIVPRP